MILISDDFEREKRFLDALIFFMFLSLYVQRPPFGLRVCYVLYRSICLLCSLYNVKILY